MLFRSKSKYKLSARLFNADLDGPYPVELGNPLYPAIDDTIVIIPFFFISEVLFNKQNVEIVQMYQLLKISALNKKHRIY